LEENLNKTIPQEGTGTRKDLTEGKLIGNSRQIVKGHIIFEQ